MKEYKPQISQIFIFIPKTFMPLRGTKEDENHSGEEIWIR